MGVVEAEQAPVAAVVQRQLVANAVRPRFIRLNQPYPALGPRTIFEKTA